MGAAGLGTGDAISSDVAFKRALDQVNKEMDTKRADKKQAPLLPVKVIASMEMLVMSEANATFIRFAAWCKLIKIWTANRTDDHQGISLKSLKFSKAGLHGIFWSPRHNGIYYLSSGAGFLPSTV